MNTLTLDFETYYDPKYSLKRLTIAEYVHDARFHAHGFAIRHPDGRTEFRTDVPAALQELQQSYGEQLERVTVAGHNLAFDLYVLRHRYGVIPRFFVDTLLLAYHVLGRKGDSGGVDASLGGLADRFGLPSKRDLDFMLGVRNPGVQQLADLSVYARRDVEITQGLAEILLPLISRPEVELPLMMHTLRLFVERGIRINTEEIPLLVNQIRQQSEEFFRIASANDEQISRDSLFVPLLEQALARTGRKVPLKQGKNGLIPAVAKNDEAMQQLVEDDDPVVAALAQARLKKKSESQLLARLGTLERITHATGGYLPPHLVYYGAHTGRFAGGGRFNIQNLGKEGFGARTRGLLIPGTGRQFILGDFAQIEARITAWLAGQDDQLADFAADRDLYSAFASGIFHEEVRKPKKDDPEAIGHRLGSLRQVGKQAILGLGFGMGALRFINTLRSKRETALLFDNGLLSESRCLEIVRAYRQQYSKIPEFWKAVESAFREAVDGTDATVGPLSIRKAQDRTGSVVCLRLPSGRELRYPNARLEDRQRTIKFLNELGQVDEFTPEGTCIVYGKGSVLYGGKLTENIAQAVARDLLVEAILALEQQGLPVLFHVHDEIVLEVPEADSSQVAPRLKTVMEGVTSWAPGLPVATEVRVSSRYGK